MSKFFGYTNIDGTKSTAAKESWPFGTVGPITEYGFRYVPDSVLLEDTPKRKRYIAKSVLIEPGESVFGKMATALSNLSMKVSK